MNFVVQGLVPIGNAIKQFFQQAAEFLVDLGMKVVGAIKEFLGQVARAVEAIGEVLNEVLNWILKFVAGIIADIIRPLATALRQVMDDYMAKLGAALSKGVFEFETGGVVSAETLDAITSRTFASLFASLILLGTAISVALIAVSTIPIAGLIAAAIGTIIVIVLLAQLFSTSEFTTISVFPEITSLTSSGIFAKARDFAKGNVHSPPNFDALLATYEIWFAAAAGIIDVIIITADSDPSGWISFTLGIIITLLALAMTVWIRDQSPSNEVSETALDMLALGGISWAVFGIIFSILALHKVQLQLKPFAAVALLLSFVSLGFGVGALL